MAVADQDSIWAIGSPNATDLCLRCHMPKGWLEGRSDTPNGSAMTTGDFDGVQCDFCHRMWDPHFEDLYQGTREGADRPGYWDEAGNSGPGSGTLAQIWADAVQMHGIEYSRLHKSKYYCATCHDVSNPVLANLGADPNQPLPGETAEHWNWQP